jgi:small subunit ribosomal protein S8
MSVDSVGNFLTIIRNGVLVSKPYVIAPFSKIRLTLAQILKDEGFIKDFAMLEDEAGKKTIKLFLKYVDGESVIHEITRMSKPGRRLYAGVHNIQPVIGGLGVSILTTDQGIVTHKQAKKLGIGGEVICTIW